MFSVEKSHKKIGKYLRSLINERYKSERQFWKAFLRLQGVEDTDEATHKLQNRFSFILNGDVNHSLQTDDLPFLSELLGVSCEEILSAGKHYVPTKNHITNYEIARSKDRKAWDKYMKREDKLFLNRDEYRKSVIDYALEFKNYEFMKYLLEEGFIWFVDHSKEGYELCCYGADTKIKPNLGRFGDCPDQFLPHELYEHDRLRTQTAVLAIQNGDCDILDSLLAREIPNLHEIDIYGNRNISFECQRNDDLIDAITVSGNEKIIDYFSEEFIVQDRYKNENIFMFPFLNEIIEILLDNKKNEFAEVIIRRAINHNKNTYEKISGLIEKGCDYYRDHMINKRTEDEIKREVSCCFNYNSENNCVTFFFNSRPIIGTATNIIQIKSKKGSLLLKQLVKELNDWYKRVISLGGEKYAEILL